MKMADDKGTLETDPCPECGSRRVQPIMYGMPCGPVDGVVLGGCVVDAGNPTHACLDCGHRWGRLDDMGWM